MKISSPKAEIASNTFQMAQLSCIDGNASEFKKQLNKESKR
jgi:hypothetical protein